MSVIIDLNLVCLVCLRKATKYHSIFDADEQTPQMPIIEKICKCTDFNFETDSAKLPDKICEVCLSDLEASWRFRQNCKEANTVFQYIQQRDDDAEVVATLTLEQQQIKLPLGLKIMKMINKEHQTAPKVFKVNKRCEAVAPSTDDDSQDYQFLANEHTTPDQTEDEDAVIEEMTVVNDALTEDEEHLSDATNVAASTKSHAVKKLESQENNVKPIKRGRGRPKKTVTQSSSILAEQNEDTETNVQQQQQEQEQTTKDIVDASLSQGNKRSTASVSDMKNTPTRRRRTLPAELRSPKICEVCGNSYKYQHALNAHMRRHNNVRPFACEFCDKSFVACVELQRHMRVHTGHKPYACQYCDRRFSDFGSRLKHERTHTGERPYSCGTCNKTFAYAHVLSVHMRTHTGEKRFQCQRCGRGFTKKAYLLTHMQQHGGRLGCVPRHVEQDDEHNQNENEFIQEDNIYTTEYIVEELNENDDMVLVKNEKIGKYEYEDGEIDSVTECDEDMQELEPKPEDDEAGDEQMAEEHLVEDCGDDDDELVFELR